MGTVLDIFLGVAVNDGLIVLQRLLSFVRQLITPNCELLRQFFLRKMVSQSLVQIGRFISDKPATPFFLRMAFFMVALIWSSESKADSIKA